MLTAYHATTSPRCRSIGVQKRYDDILAQCALDARCMGFVPRALQNLKQNEIAGQERFADGGRFELVRGCRALAPQMRNPDRAIDQNHFLRAE